MRGIFVVLGILALPGCKQVLGFGTYGPDDPDAKTDSPVDTSNDAFVRVEQDAYLKASNTTSNSRFGGAIAMSADGNTLAVGATGEDSNATGVDGDQNNTLASTSGAVYVFRRTGSVWVQEAYLKASNTGSGDSFGSQLALADDGSTLAVGAPGEDSETTGINSTPNDLGSAGGAVYVFVRSGSSWSQQAYVKASNTETAAVPGDTFGTSVALSGDGDTLAVGAPNEDSSTFGIDPVSNNSAASAGAAYVFVRNGTTWSQQAFIKQPTQPGGTTITGDDFGFRVALSNNGSVLAIGAPFERSSTTGINTVPDDAVFSPAGAVYILTRTGTTWSHSTYIKASNTDSNDQFGGRIALSGDGAVLAVSAIGEASGATGIGGSEIDNGQSDSGAVYLFRNTGSWSQFAYVKASNTQGDDQFGFSVALSDDGTRLVVGADQENSSATGVDGNQLDENQRNSGAVYLFTNLDTGPMQYAYLKASNTGADDGFGSAVAIASDGTIAVGALGEASLATGIDGDQTIDSASDAGAVYVMHVVMP